MLTNNPDKIVSTNPALPVAPRDRLSIPPPPPPPPVILHFPTSKIILSSTQENSYIKFLKPIEIRRELYRGGIVVVVVVVDNGQEWGKGGRSGIARPDLPQRLRLTEGRGEGTILQDENDTDFHDRLTARIEHRSLKDTASSSFLSRKISAREFTNFRSPSSSFPRFILNLDLYRDTPPYPLIE